MRIRNVELSNVKSFNEQVVIEFDPRLNILVGPNAGGKSNLLDILTIVLRKYFAWGYYVFSGTDNQVSYSNLNLNSSVFEPIGRYLEPFRGSSGQPRVALTFEVTDGDVQNIALINEWRADLEAQLRTYRSAAVPNIGMVADWRELISGTSITFVIESGNPIGPSDRTAYLFLQYLNYFNLLSVLAGSLPNRRLNSLFLYFPPHRGVIREEMGANLSGGSFSQTLATHHGASSKTPGSLLSLATLYFAEKRRQLEEMALEEGYRGAWTMDAEVAAINSRFLDLGYSWDLRLRNRNQNLYEVVLSSNGTSYDLGQASSGETEFLNFLLGLHSMNVRQGVVIIDEPELHLHPRWQSKLRELFLALADEMGDQFILATHSPSFINVGTILNTIRVYRTPTGSSRTAVFSRTDIGTAKDLLHIVKTENNERMFFADRVVLVEGDVDTIVFRKMVSTFTSGSQLVVEVLGVGGKTMLMKYREFLMANGTPNAIIADFDYISEVGDNSVKALLGTVMKRVEDRVLKDKKSKDGRALMQAIERALETGNCDQLRQLWDHIKARHIGIRDDLTPKERQLVEKEMNNLMDRQIVLLPGEIEDYLPAGCRGVAEAIELVKDANFTTWLDDESQSAKRTVLEQAVFRALGLDYATRDTAVGNYRSVLTLQHETGQCQNGY